MESLQHIGKRVKENNEMGNDRLSNLPDAIIYHILSFMDTKYAVQTCVLSKKWTDHWTYIHSLNFDCRTFDTTSGFRKFVYHVLQHRERVHLYKVRFYYGDKWHPVEVKLPFLRVMLYAISECVKEVETDIKDFPPCLECQTLRTLRLGNCNVDGVLKSVGTSSLTTLQLSGVRISNKNYRHDLFSHCLNLEKLLLVGCRVRGLEILNICSPQLVNLTISNLHYYSSKKNRKLVISSPKLKFFDFKGTYPLVLEMDKHPTPENVNIDLLSPSVWRERSDWKEGYICYLISMAEELSHSKSLTISLNFSKGKFILHRGTPVTEIEIVELNKEIA